MGLTDEQIKALKEEHGDSLVAVEKPFEMVFKKPTREAWADFQDAVAKGKGTREAAYRRLCCACSVHPKDIEEVKTAFNQFPALPVKLGESLANMAGAGDEFEAKKL